MKTIGYEQAVYLSEHNEEIESVCEQYRLIMAKCSTDTIFQLSHHALLDKGYDLYDYVVNGDISETTLLKIKKFIEEAIEVIESEEFKSIKEISTIVASVLKKKDNKNGGINN